MITDKERHTFLKENVMRKLLEAVDALKSHEAETLGVKDARTEARIMDALSDVAKKLAMYQTTI